jgi:hypothetical protein
MRERRAANVKRMVEIKEADPDANAKVVKDNLYVDNHPVPSLFSVNTLETTEVVRPMLYDDLTHTPVVEVGGNTFQGHAVAVDSEEIAASALEALFQNKSVATSSSIMYAYKIEEGSYGPMKSGHYDDKEWLGSAVISKAISAHTNIFVAVSRTKQRSNLGKARFDNIKRVADEAIKLLQDSALSAPTS